MQQQLQIQIVTFDNSNESFDRGQYINGQNDSKGSRLVQKSSMMTFNDEKKSGKQRSKVRFSDTQKEFDITHSKLRHLSNQDINIFKSSSSPEINGDSPRSIKLKNRYSKQNQNTIKLEHCDQIKITDTSDEENLSPFKTQANFLNIQKANQKESHYKKEKCLNIQVDQQRQFSLKVTDINALKNQHLKQFEKEAKKGLLYLQINGIKAVKHHYATKETRSCIIKISEDLNFLCWEYHHLKSHKPPLKKQIALKDVIGIIYGGQITTFLLQKENILKIILNGDENKHPFYAWECISIETQNRTLDLVIKDQAQLMWLLSVLLILVKMNKAQELFISDLNEIRSTNKIGSFKICKNDLRYRSFRLMRVKMKVSYEACKQRISILEVFLRAIYITYKQIYANQLSLSPLQRADTLGIAITDENDEDNSESFLQNTFNMKTIKRQIHKLKSLKFLRMVLNQNKYQKLRFLLKQMKLSKINLTKTIKLMGTENLKIPEEFMIFRLSNSFQFYDPFPVIVETVMRKKALALQLDKQKKSITKTDSFFKCFSSNQSPSKSISFKSSKDDKLLSIYSKDKTKTKSQIKQVNEEINNKQIFLKQLVNLNLKSQFLRTKRKYTEDNQCTLSKQANRELQVSKNQETLQKIKSSGNEIKKIKVLDQLIGQEIKYFSPKMEKLLGTQEEPYEDVINAIEQRLANRKSSVNDSMQQYSSKEKIRPYNPNLQGTKQNQFQNNENKQSQTDMMKQKVASQYKFNLYKTSSTAAHSQETNPSRKQAIRKTRFQYNEEQYETPRYIEQQKEITESQLIKKEYNQKL
ncbi:UNKNOWN [Stylonychia lemnae]|uniref:Uncharacterized protein n=1 Tax=Stylonychia lemnae TaxID=5949 RepID=A0A077ZV68_STYLE|nr:UNKNOWN [Stylonychia lemnae]|eukprot:CDW73195.1 UNKNOWN [Stylonychia lemnae]